MILLDTHAWVWWMAAPDRIPRKAGRVIARALEQGKSLLVSSISVWEVAMLVAARRLTLTLDVEAWLAHAEALPFLEFVPVDNRTAVRAVQLEGFPQRDPADRLIVATALGHGATLVTGDGRMRRYRPVATVWS